MTVIILQWPQGRSPLLLRTQYHTMQDRGRRSPETPQLGRGKGGSLYLGVLVATFSGCFKIVISLPLFLYYNIILAILVPLSFNISFTIILPPSVKKNLAESFIEIALNNAIYKFEGEMTSLYAESSNSRTWYVSSPI